MISTQFNKLFQKQSREMWVAREIWWWQREEENSGKSNTSSRETLSKKQQHFAHGLRGCYRVGMCGIKARTDPTRVHCSEDRQDWLWLDFLCLGAEFDAHHRADTAKVRHAELLEKLRNYNIKFIQFI